MKLGAFIDGLQTLRPYYKGGDGYHIDCEHDQFYARATDEPMSDVDVARMRELGWFQPEISDQPYDPLEGWSAFT
jgi:hypothetical protein